MERFNKFTFGNKKTAGGVLIFPNTYEDIHEMKTAGFTIDKEQQEHIKTNVFDYFAVNENILQSKSYGDEWLAFYESFVEWFAIQLGEVVSGMIYSDRERGAYENPRNWELAVPGLASRQHPADSEFALLVDKRMCVLHRPAQLTSVASWCEL